MNNLNFDLSKKGGSFKILNATNGGPWGGGWSSHRSTFADYKAAGFPYSRNHDSGVLGTYGGPFSHDISRIFPNFDADVNDPASYDFACTDHSILQTLEAGTKTFFRLGQTIEHQVKKHDTLPPRDFNKWAVICEHIIKHYTEGWANGYKLDMPYWEIWNEPNLDPDDGTNKKCWGGTSAEFFDLYEITAKHLKKCFPHLKIGGPAYAGNEPLGQEKWADTFLGEMKKRNVPIDFFSWHQYESEPKRIINLGENLKKLLVKHGYDKAESICNEWNYIKDWDVNYTYSMMCIHGLKNASFVTAMMALAQKSSVDMLMYYDTRPTTFCGVFDLYSYKPLKGYYPFKWYSMFYSLENEVQCENEPKNIYSLCGTDRDGKVLSMITYYTDDDNAPNKEITVDFGKESTYEIYLLDNNHDAELIETTDKLTFDMKVHNCILIKEK
ncbi:MAG: hypothetical protein IKJ68_09395 [Clostridia bacterium]|nr:hypothetical protein [Clostridia bacterium]